MKAPIAQFASRQGTGLRYRSLHWPSWSKTYLK